MAIDPNERPPIVLPPECHYRTISKRPNGARLRGAVLSELYRNEVSHASGGDTDAFSARDKLLIQTCVQCILTLCPDMIYLPPDGKAPGLPIGQIVEVEQQSN